jgi:hypothetical protein
MKIFAKHLLLGLLGAVTGVALAQAISGKDYSSGVNRPVAVDRSGDFTGPRFTQEQDEYVCCNNGADAGYIVLDGGAGCISDGGSGCGGIGCCIVAPDGGGGTPFPGALLNRMGISIQNPSGSGSVCAVSSQRNPSVLSGATIVPGGSATTNAAYSTTLYCSCVTALTDGGCLSVQEFAP